MKRPTKRKLLDLLLWALATAIVTAAAYFWLRFSYIIAGLVKRPRSSP